MSEKSQDEIRFDHLNHNMKYSWWSKYNLEGERAFGKILHFLYAFGTFIIAENAGVHDGFIELWNEKIAKYSWREDNTPEFALLDIYSSKSAEYYGKMIVDNQDFYYQYKQNN